MPFCGRVINIDLPGQKNQLTQSKKRREHQAFLQAPVSLVSCSFSIIEVVHCCAQTEEKKVY